MKQRNYNIIFYATVALMLLMLLLRNGLKVSIPISLVLMVSVLPAFFASPSQIVAMAAAFIPMSAGFQIKYAILAYLLIGVVRYRNSLQRTGVVVPLLLMMVWELGHGLGMEFTLSEYLRDFSELIFLVFVTTLKWDRVDFKIISRLLAISTVGVSLIIIYIQLNSGLEGLLEMFSEGTSHYRFGRDNTEEGTLFGLNYNPNQLGFICILSIVSTLTLVARREHQFIDLVLMVLCIFFGFITLSRAFVLVLIFAFGSFILFSPGSRGERTRNILLLLAVAPLMLWFIMNYLPSVMESFLGRMQVDDITNGRTHLLGFYNDHIFSSFENCFWGLGLQNYGVRIEALYGHQIEVCHNGFQEIWLTWGFPGVLLFCWMMIEMLRGSHRWSGVRPFFAFVPLAVMLFNSMAGQLISSGNNLLSLSLFYAVLSMKWHSGGGELSRR